MWPQYTLSLTKGVNHSLPSSENSRKLLWSATQWDIIINYSALLPTQLEATYVLSSWSDKHVIYVHMYLYEKIWMVLGNFSPIPF